MRLVLVFLCAFSASAQIPQPSVAPTPVTSTSLPQERIGNNDLVQIEVYESQELSGSFRVDAKGNLHVPMLPDQAPVHAAGLYPNELAQAYAEELKSSQLLVRPMVRVSVSEYQSRTVTVSGSVRHPVSFQAYGRVTLLDAINRADGLLDNAGNEVILTIPSRDGSQPFARRFAVSQLISNSAQSEEILLHGGEEIRVPEEGKISILGDVKRPGVFPVKTSDDTSLLSLLARSEGLLPNASSQAYIYRRQEDGKEAHEIPLNIDRILSRKAPDISLVAGDILYVPDNRGRRLTLGVLEKLATFGSVTSSAFIYANTR